MCRGAETEKDFRRYRPVVIQYVVGRSNIRALRQSFAATYVRRSETDTPDAFFGLVWPPLAGVQ